MMAQVTRKGRWMPIVLAVSLAVNLGVGAMVAGAAWRHSGERDGARGGEGGPVYMQALPPEARRALRAQLRDLRRGGPSVAQMADVLRAEPFDPAAAARVLEEGRATRRAGLEAGDAAWVVQITAMSAEARRATADRLETLDAQRRARREERRQDRESRQD